MKETKNSTWNQKLYSNSILKNTINGIFRSARENKTSHSDILKSIKERVYTTAKYTTLPKYMQSAINGYIEANCQIMYEHVYFAHWYDGKFVGKDLPYGSSFKQELIEKSAYVYKGTEIAY